MTVISESNGYQVKRLWYVEARASAIGDDTDERCSWNGFASDSIEATQLALLSFKHRQLEYAPELLRVVKVSQVT